MAHKDKINRIPEFEGNPCNWYKQFSPGYAPWCMFLKDNFFFFTLRPDISSVEGSETFANCDWDESTWGEYSDSDVLLNREGTCPEQD